MLLECRTPAPSLVGAQAADNRSTVLRPDRVGAETYVDSPIFLDIVLGVAAVGFGAAAWLKAAQPSPNILESAALLAVALLMVVAALRQKRGTFIFDPSVRTLTWTSRGVRESKKGSVPFADVRITLDASTDEGHVNYRVMINTPQRCGIGSESRILHVP